MSQIPLYYDDICLIPNNYSELMSRDHADTSVKFLGKTYTGPVILANMQSVVNKDICRRLQENNYFYIMHRFGYNIENGLSITQDLAKTANEENWKLISISTGVNKESDDDLNWILKNEYQVDTICIDVALGFHLKVEQRIKFIQKYFPETKIIAGNVAERKGAEFLADLGVNAIKVGIAGGTACTTRFQTGFAAPMLWSIQQARAGAKKIPIIADGAIKMAGDVAKALTFTADVVMIGSMFASCVDSAAELTSDGKKHYYGSASFSSKKHSKNIEGIDVMLEPDKTILEKMDEINQSLQSAISYAGGTKLEDLKKVDWLFIK